MPLVLLSQERPRDKASIVVCVMTNNKFGVCETAPKGKALAAKSHDLSLIPRTHMIKGENQVPRVVL